MYSYTLKPYIISEFQNSYNFMTLAKEEAKEGILQDVNNLLGACPEESHDVSTHIFYL